MKILVDTADDIQYKSFYIYALLQHFGGSVVEFADAPFRDLTEDARNTKTFRFVISKAALQKRYVVDCNDFNTLNKELYEWCDVYGKINCSEDLDNKIIRLCPSFSIRYTSRFNSVIKALSTLPYCHANPKKHLGKWKRMIRRPVYEDYFPSSPSAHFLFHCSTLWQSDEWNRNDQTVNLFRANYIKACRNLGNAIEFEGGFVSYRTDEDSHRFDDLLVHPYSARDYLRLTKKSTVVFNTPAYWGCHGWKLGEFMALGKAIISTRLINALPAPLINGKHAHFLESTEESEIEDAIKFLLSHQVYRERLETGIFDYWNSYGSPEATLKLLGITE